LLPGEEGITTSMAASRKGILRYQTERTPRVSIAAIPTRYAGCRFRSRLEARWAVFFDAMGIEWQYEPQGYKIGGRNYLPDFLLPKCGTWVEVKGSEDALDKRLMRVASRKLPEMPWHGDGPGPRLMILGPIPVPPSPEWSLTDRNEPIFFAGDLGWIGFSGEWNRYGFGHWPDHGRPWYWDSAGEDSWTVAEEGDYWDCQHGSDPFTESRAAYLAARGARFEHGESGAGPARCSGLRPW
jgi:hypothetical protein